MPGPIFGGSSGGGSGTVTSTSVVTANGISGTVATATTTPALTLSLGAITPTTVNGNTLTTGTYTLTGQAGKTLTFNGSLTLTGTDGQTYTFPATSATIARTDAANSFTGVQSMTNAALTTPAITGLATGSGVASAATASTLASRDANGILSAVNFNAGSTSTVTAAGTTTLTVSSPGIQIATGSSTQTYVMPVSSTLAVGQGWLFFNNSTGAITIQTSAPTTMLVMAGNTAALVTCSLASGTTAASWTLDYGAVNVASGKVVTINNSITLAGTDAQTYTFPTTSATIARTDAANTFTGTQTFGAVVGTTWNGNTWATGTGTLAIAAGKTFTNSNTITLAGTDAQTYTFPTTSATIARTDAANTFTGVQTMTSPALTTPAITGLATGSGVASAATASTLVARNANGSIILPACTTSIPNLNLPSGTVETTPAAGDLEFDGVQLYGTIDTTSSRGAVPLEQYFHLAANGSNITTTIANFFGTTSNIALVASAYYEIDIVCFFAKTTSEALTWTLTNSAAPTSQNITYEMSPITGIVAPPGTATNLFGQYDNDTTAARTIVTGSLTTAVNHYAHFHIFLKNGTGTSLKIQATNPAGSITPHLGSRWSCRRISPNNIGTFVA